MDERVVILGDTHFGDGHPNQIVCSLDVLNAYLKVIECGKPVNAVKVCLLGDFMGERIWEDKDG